MLVSRRVGILIDDAIAASGEDREEDANEFDNDGYTGTSETGSDFYWGIGVWIMVILKKMDDA